VTKNEIHTAMAYQYLASSLFVGWISLWVAGATLALLQIVGLGLGVSIISAAAFGSKIRHLLPGQKKNQLPLMVIVVVFLIWYFRQSTDKEAIVAFVLHPITLGMLWLYFIAIVFRNHRRALKHNLPLKVTTGTLRGPVAP